MQSRAAAPDRTRTGPAVRLPWFCPAFNAILPAGVIAHPCLFRVTRCLTGLFPARHGGVRPCSWALPADRADAFFGLALILGEGLRTVAWAASAFVARHLPPSGSLILTGRSQRHRARVTNRGIRWCLRPCCSSSRRFVRRPGAVPATRRGLVAAFLGGSAEHFIHPVNDLSTTRVWPISPAWVLRSNRWFQH